MYIHVRTKCIHVSISTLQHNCDISYLDLVGLVAASVGKHFPILVEHMELEDHYKRSSHTYTLKASSRVTLQKRKLAEAVLTEVQGLEALDYKELGYMVP